MRYFIGLFILIISLGLKAQDTGFYQAGNLQKVELAEVLKAIPKGSVVFIGEQHGYASIQKGQLDVLNGLRQAGHKVHVGMEFLDYTQQLAVDQFRAGQLNEADFLKQVAWGSTKFDYYRDQILFPQANKGERTFAINSPRWLSGEVSKKGLAGLSEEALKLLPPQFQLGRDSYKKRFTDLMSGHVTNPESMQRYFEAQCLWDDTMAWKLAEASVAPEDTIVVVVGQFHVEHGGGLPFQFQQRNPNRPVIIIDELLFWDDEAVPFKDLAPHPEYGPLGDFLYITIEKS
jgi:uncharacterized iron-regulated protein